MPFPKLFTHACDVFRLVSLCLRRRLVLCASDSRFYTNTNAIKLAVVRGRLALVYRRNHALAAQDYRRLQCWALRCGALWICDRRSRAYNGQTNTITERRRQTQLGAIIIWLLGVSACPVFAKYACGVANETYYASSVENATVVRSLALFNYPPVQEKAIAASDMASASLQPYSYAINTEHYRKSRAILLDKWQQKKGDPVFLYDDLDELARYISSQPEAYKLLVSLRDQPLKLRYRPQNFSTVVKGNAVSVRSVTLYFDPRSAVVMVSDSRCERSLGACMASPADAFIHELIHAKIALLETSQFVRSGALNQAFYPHAHEREVLRRERAIYRSMTALDSRARPDRRQHSGSLTLAACVTCLGTI